MQRARRAEVVRQNQQLEQEPIQVATRSRLRMAPGLVDGTHCLAQLPADAVLFDDATSSEQPLPLLRERGARVVANFWGDSPDEFADCAARLDGAPGVVALELNAASPNRPEWGSILAADPVALGGIVRAVRPRVRAVPLWVKLSPNVADIATVGRAAEAEGADALSAINTLRGLAIDLETRRPRLATGGGGLSGPAIKPVALRMAHDLARAVRIPVVGIGGIRTGEDALEFLACGASAVQVGTATFYDPRSPVRIADEMKTWCKAHGVTAVRDIIGSLRA